MLEGGASPRKQARWPLSSPTCAVAPRAVAHPDWTMSSHGPLKSPQGIHGARAVPRNAASDLSFLEFSPLEVEWDGPT
eukprot:6415947-Pyramimonas_sp.AAC.1